MATAYDYTREQTTPFDDDAADNFEIADVVAPQKSADEIEQERSFRDIPPGDHELVVIGFLNPPKIERKEAYINGKRIGFDAPSIIVKFGLANDPTAQVTDYFLLPPSDGAGLQAYYEGLPKPDAKGNQKGFNASKFYHFIERLGFPYPKGGQLPAEARRIGNWKGRTIHATVEPGKPYTDQTTGDEKAGRAQIKLFSYRASQSTVNSGSSYATPVAPSNFNRPQAASASPAPSRPVAAMTNRGPVAPRGLDNI